MSDNVYEDYEPPVSQGLYHAFEDKKEYTFRIASDPVAYISSFTNKGTGEVTDRMLYAWIVWNIDEKMAQVLKLPVTAYRQIAKYGADPEYGDPKNYNIRVTRTGTGLKTTYDVVASPTKNDLAEIAPESVEAILAVDIIEAVSKGKGVSNVNWLRDVAAKQKDEVKPADPEQNQNVKTDDKKPSEPGEEPW